MKVPKKRVLIITPFCKPNLGGAETLLEDFTEYARAHHYSIYIQTYQPITTPGVKGKAHEKKKNLEIFRHSWPGFNLFHKLEPYPGLNFFYLVPGLLFYSLLFMLKNHKKIEVVNPWGFASAVVARLLKVFFKKKTVLMVVSLYEFKKRPLYSKLIAWLIKDFDHITTESLKSKKEIAGLSFPKKRITAFNEWVNLNRFKPAERVTLKKKLGWQKKFIVLFVGRAIAIKGTDILLKAAQKVNPKINFAFVSGAGPQVNLLKKAAKKHKNITFVGPVPYQRLHLYYQAADLFSLPSRYQENVARTMLEAIACGSPVIASNMGAVPQALDKSVAVLIKPTVKNFAKEIEKLYNKPNNLARLQKNCRPYALKHFSVKNAQKIADCYEKT